MGLLYELNHMQQVISKAKEGFVENSLDGLLTFFGLECQEGRFLTRHVHVQEAVDKIGPLIETTFPGKWKIHRDTPNSYWYESNMKTGEISFVLGYEDSPLFFGNLHLGKRVIELVDLERCIEKDKKNLGRNGMSFASGDLQAHQDAFASRDELLAVLKPHGFRLGTIEEV